MCRFCLESATQLQVIGLILSGVLPSDEAFTGSGFYRTRSSRVL